MGARREEAVIGVQKRAKGIRGKGSSNERRGLFTKIPL